VKLEIEREVVEVYRVRYTSEQTWPHPSSDPLPRRKYKTLFTLKGALEKAAWWIIWDRYGYWADGQDDQWAPSHLPECSCYGIDNSYHLCWEDCELHDRDSGYFRRLHTRLVRWLETGYVLPGSIS